MSNFNVNNIRILFNVRSRFLYFKSVVLILVVIVLISLLFLLRISKAIYLEGYSKCNKKECIFTIPISGKFDIKVGDSISFDDKSFKILKVMYDEPYVSGSNIINNLMLALDKDSLQNNQVLKGKIVLEKKSLFALFWQSLKGGD